MEIKQMIMPSHLQSGRTLVPKWITIHETDNINATADATAHAKLQYNGNSRNAHWHYQVDSDEIIQSVPDNVDAWAAGDGLNGPGNDTSLHIEICVNSDGNYKKACENAAWLVRYLMSKYNLGIEKVVQHNKWSGKNCPRHLRAGDWGLTWASFVDMCKNENGWKHESGKWYFYQNGTKKTGWLQDKAIWYYLDAAGVMKTGWVKVNGKWYYLNPKGDMRVGWLLDKEKWYYLGSDGAMRTGIIEDKGKLYYLQSDGSMAVNTRINTSLNVDKNGVLKP